jgi:hypothetical protein
MKRLTRTLSGILAIECDQPTSDERSVSSRGEDEKGAASDAEKQAHDPELASFCERGDCGDGNRDLEHGHAAGEHFVLVKV